MKKVEILAIEEKLTESGCGCGTTSSMSACCDSETAASDMTIDNLVDRFNATNPNLADFTINYLKNSKTSEYIKEVNQILANNGEQLVVNELNKDFVLKKILPMVVVNGNIVAINNLPIDKELQNAIETEERIVVKAGCC